jgi:hypothetical protein
MPIGRERSSFGRCQELRIGLGSSPLLLPVIHMYNLGTVIATWVTAHPDAGESRLEYQTRSAGKTHSVSDTIKCYSGAVVG